MLLLYVVKFIECDSVKMSDSALLHKWTLNHADNSVQLSYLLAFDRSDKKNCRILIKSDKLYTESIDTKNQE